MGAIYWPLRRVRARLFHSPEGCILPDRPHPLPHPDTKLWSALAKASPFFFSLLAARAQSQLDRRMHQTQMFAQLVRQVAPITFRHAPRYIDE